MILQFFNKIYQIKINMQIGLKVQFKEFLYQITFKSLINKDKIVEIFS